MIDHFAPSFVPAYYRSLHDDLANHSDEDIAGHYEAYGTDEGRLASPQGERTGFTSAFNNAKRPLEIGPFFKPMLSGGTAKFFDVMDQDALKARAVTIGGDPEGVPFIDFVSPIGDLSVVEGTFDLVTSSHCIEHQPDLIRHLQDVEALLDFGGVYALIVPDRRYCFDFFLHDTHIGELLEAFHSKRKIHGLAKIIEHRAMTAHHDTSRHWRGDHGPKPKNMDVIKHVIAQYLENPNAYIDVHEWQFTPRSFASIIADLNELGLLSLKLARLYETVVDTHEFCAVLVK